MKRSKKDVFADGFGNFDRGTWLFSLAKTQRHKQQKDEG